MNPIILVSNDDGYAARGLDSLLNFISPVAKEAGAEILVMAPSGPRSGKSSAITHDGPVTLRQLEPHVTGAEMNVVSGTPVDCIKLGLHLLKKKGLQPALILSGINHGSNSAVSVTYSGTMGCALEGATNDIPSIGFSLLDYSPEADFEGCRETVQQITRTVLHKGLPHRVCLNVNIPAHCQPHGIRLTRAARGYWTEEYADYTDPLGRPFYWITGHFHNLEPESRDTDEYWLSRDWSTVVPIMADLGTDAETTCLIATLFENVEDFRTKD